MLLVSILSLLEAVNQEHPITMPGCDKVYDALGPYIFTLLGRYVSIQSLIYHTEFPYNYYLRIMSVTLDIIQLLPMLLILLLLPSTNHVAANLSMCINRTLWYRTLVYFVSSLVFFLTRYLQSDAIIIEVQYV